MRKPAPAALFACCVAAGVVVAGAGARAETFIVGQAAGLDEDSIAVQGERIRLWGIDGATRLLRDF